MKTNFILLITILFSFSSFAQNEELVIRNKKSGKEKTVSEQKTIKLFLNDLSVNKGPLEIIDNSSVVIGGDTVKLTNIQKIRTKSLASQITGGVVTFLGSATTALGTYIFVDLLFIHPGFFEAIVGVVLGIPIAATGIIITGTGLAVLLIGKKYPADKWDYSIRRLQ